MSKLIKMKGGFQRLLIYQDQLKKNSKQLGEIEIELLTSYDTSATPKPWLSAIFASMKCLTQRAFLLTAILLCTSIFAQSQLTKKVLIIGIDGCRSDALQFSNTPNIDALIANGFYSPDALNNDITSSGPAWSSILSGVTSAKHLVTSNAFATDDFATYPTIFSRVENFDPSLNTASICHWSPINTNIVQGSADFILNVGSDADLSVQAVNHLTSADPDCMFIHFDDVDHAGHAYGYSITIPEYVTAIEGVDVLIGPVIAAIAARPTYGDEDWLIVLTPDHGGLGTSHGGNSIDEQRIFFIASGDNVPVELLEASETVVVDSPNCLGTNIPELTFDGNDDYVQVLPNAIFDFGTAQDFTMECRVRTTAAADVAIMGNKDWDTGFNPGIVMSFAYPSGPEWKVNIGDGASRVDLENGGSIADNEWYTLSVSCDRDGLMRMYEDGVMVDSGDISGIGNITTGAGWFMGADIDQGYDYSGSMAEVRIWNSVIGGTEIANWHCSELNGTHPDYADLLGYWKLNEGGGATVASDSSGNGNDGSIVNSLWDEDNTTIVYDYANTPRLSDVPITAMTQLCIEIDPVWNLDGVSHVAACQLIGCDGDFDLDGNIDVADLLIFLSVFGCTSSCGDADLNADGSVLSDDTLIFLTFFGTNCQ